MIQNNTIGYHKIPYNTIRYTTEWSQKTQYKTTGYRHSVLYYDIETGTICPHKHVIFDVKMGCDWIDVYVALENGHYYLDVIQSIWCQTNNTSGSIFLRLPKNKQQ